MKKACNRTIFSLLMIFAMKGTVGFAFEVDSRAILLHAPTLNEVTLNRALKAYQWALQNHHLNKKNILTIIDFNLPSYEQRLWVIDLKHNAVLMNTYTTQGKYSGRVFAKKFSNKIRSKQTSLGAYKTLAAYHGAHGFSERLQGLQFGINNNALTRAIVIHPAWYAASDFIKKHHRAGNSWGCFALDPQSVKKFINLTAGGSLIFAYASQNNL